MNRDEFIKAFYEIFERVMFFSTKAWREGLLNLEKDIDNGKVQQRDILEYGMSLVMDGTDPSIIGKILSNIIKQEKDEARIVLKTIQKEAVLLMQDGMNPLMMAAVLNSYTDIPLDDPEYNRIINDRKIY